MRGIRRAERLFHFAVKQVTKPPHEGEKHERWVDYLFSINNTLGYLRTRYWDWPEEEVEGE